jgi:phosphoribosylanthranilate isomerase
MKIKVCGMTDPLNVEEVAGLNPDYLGFILFKGSPRYVDIETAARLSRNIPATVIKTGVLVNETFENAVKTARSGIFDLLQLHGDETVEYCARLSEEIKIMKAFRIADRLPDGIKDYVPFCNLFLFDSATEKFGGSGRKFDHSLLDESSFDKEFMLGGGISGEDHEYLRTLKNEKLSGIDLNSRFEIKPGIKNINLLKEFIEKIRTNEYKN